MEDIQSISELKDSRIMDEFRIF